MSNDDDGWNDYTYQTSVFKYSYNQFVTLRITAFGVSCVSLAFSTLIFMLYIYMWIQHRKKVNRISLRCVFLCSIIDALNAILNIISTRRLGGNMYCKAASVILVTTNLLSASLLTVVGINLVLIFVLKVGRTDLLERYYYPGVIIYAILGTVGAIYQESTGHLENLDSYSCWYFIYVEDRTYSFFSWMWFYVFLFLANLIAVACSVVAMAKLLYEHRVFDKGMRIISKNALFSSKQSEFKVKQNQNNVFTKVILRCIIYPLVPFLVNIFGFILQMVITASHKTPSFSLAMLDIIFSCIEGLLVAIVFFTDPAVTSFLKERFDDLCEKYVHQYTLIDISNYEIIQKKISQPSEPYSHFVASPTIRHFNVTDDHSLYEKSTTITKTNLLKKDSIPIRCLKLEINDNSKNHYSRSELNVAVLVDSVEIDAYLSPPTSNTEYKYVYIPYSYPRLSRCFHWFLKGLGVRPRQQTSTEDSAGSSSSTGSSHIDMPLVSKPKNVLFADTM